MAEARDGVAFMGFSYATVTSSPDLWWRAGCGGPWTEERRIF